jgi:putative glutamine amidotransferase
VVLKVAVTHGKNRSKIDPYLAALSMAGLEAVPVSAESRAVVDWMDGLVLTGGADLATARYGQLKGEESGEPDVARDAMEAELLGRALNSDLPVLAICRGMQLFNVEHGGTLIQHLENVSAHRRPGQAHVHDVCVQPGTRLAAILGEGIYGVNSRHHQAVERVGENLVVSARSPDGVVEGLERPDKRFALAVQWHPEDRVATAAGDQQLFAAFAEAVRAVAARSGRS